MAEPSSSAAASQPAPNAAPNAVPNPQNPVFRMMGMPNFRFKLPSRNWMIFLTITGSFTATLIYDRREKRRAQKKWCDLVAHLEKETLPVEQMRRKLTIFLSAPPGDGLRPAREHFKEYVKPILVAAAIDYNVIEGRREGEIRAALAERIRKTRRNAGEPSTVEPVIGIEDVVAATRKSIGVTDEPGPKGDMILGRHTWKEYVRGIHEGWLGPLDPPAPPAPEVPEAHSPAPEGTETPVTESPEEKKDVSENKEKEEEKKKPTGPTPAYIAPADYSSQSLPRTFPTTLDSVPIELPNILGFLNTPIRLYRYLTQRRLADSVGREVAGIVLASYSRPYQDGSSAEFPTDAPQDSSDPLGASRNYEQQTLLEHEEPEWHKSVHKRDQANPDAEREWLDDVVLDPRVASRMQRYVLSPEEEARSERIAEGKEYIIGEERPPHVPFWKQMWIKYGYGEDEETLKRKPILGNIDEEDA